MGDSDIDRLMHWEEDEFDVRLFAIAQNGNDGLHYDIVENNNEPEKIKTPTKNIQGTKGREESET